MLTVAGGIVLGWIVIQVIRGWALTPRGYTEAELDYWHRRIAEGRAAAREGRQPRDLGPPP